jgi:3-dehydroquinate synthase
MRRLEVTSRWGDYPVLVGVGLLESLETIIAEGALQPPCAVVSDRIVAPLWGGSVAERLGIGLDEIPGGEADKRWSAVEALCGRWLDAELDRSATVLAVGGGIVTDTVGFAAAVFMRGIGWLAAPTTLLGMVDAAIGGKTGVNLQQGKNLVGAFWPPRIVIADIATLTTLPQRELRAGLAEVIKTAWIGDQKLLQLIPSTPDLGYRSLDPAGWEELVARTAAVKIAVVIADEREAGGRRALNLGHTLGHALEAATGYDRFLHGEAVAWGIEAVAVLAHRRGLLSDDGCARLRGAVATLGTLPPIADLDPETVCGFIASDKKRDASGVGWVLPTDDGVRIDQAVNLGEMISVVRLLQESRGKTD